MKAALNRDDQKCLETLLKLVEEEAGHMLGYPGTRVLDYSPLYPFMDFLINNIGDPYSESSYRLNTHEIECEVTDWFTRVLRGDSRAIWGYVTNGGTEGNMYGIYLARELFPTGIVYYSEDTHYSVAKILRMVNARSIMIKSQDDGEIDYDDLAATLSIYRDVPAIVFANIGTTMKGAVDNLDKIYGLLKARAISRFYIHADAALSGMILPFVDHPQPFGFDAGIDSISISGHKMPGAPMPCGVVLARRAHVDRISRTVEYVGTSDTTVSGSRNGITPLFLWYAIKVLGEAGFKEMVHRALVVAEYAIERLGERGVFAWRHENSLTVVFPRQCEAVLKKWQIAVNGPDAHIITMPHVTKEKIDGFIADLDRERQKKSI